jgi:hypothetical protein
VQHLIRLKLLIIRSDIDSGSVETIAMTQGLTKRKFVLLALGFLVFNSSTTFANDDDLEALNQRIFQLFKQGGRPFSFASHLRQS